MFRLFDVDDRDSLFAIRDIRIRSRDVNIVRVASGTKAPSTTRACSGVVTSMTFKPLHRPQTHSETESPLRADA